MTHPNLIAMLCADADGVDTGTVIVFNGLLLEALEDQCGCEEAVLEWQENEEYENAPMASWPYHEGQIAHSFSACKFAF